MKSIYNGALAQQDSRFAYLAQLEEPRLLRWGARLMRFLLIGLVGVLFLPWTQNIPASGKVTTYAPALRPQTLQSPIPGRIEKWFFQEGEKVKAGDTLLMLQEIKETYFDSLQIPRWEAQIQAKKNAAQALAEKITALRQQIQALEKARDNGLARALNAIAQARLVLQSESLAYQAAKIEFQIAAYQQARQESLYKAGLRSLTELEQRRLRFQETRARLVSAQNRYLSQQVQLENAHIHYRALQAEFAEKIAKAYAELNSTESYLYDVEATIAKLENELANIRVRRNLYAVRAPQEGFVVRATKTGLGEIIKEGDPLAVLMPQSSAYATELYVRPLDVPLLAPGKKVQLQFDGWPALVFSGWPRLSYGTFPGIVQTIDYVDDGMGRFRVLITPDTTQSWPPYLRMGGGVRGWFLLNDVPVWYEIWRQINGFPPDFYAQFYQNPPKSKKSLQ
ncbi:MAG: HlyD family secretion protein [Bacteroidia bacterium]